MGTLVIVVGRIGFVRTKELAASDVCCEFFVLVITGMILQQPSETLVEIMGPNNVTGRETN